MQTSAQQCPQQAESRVHRQPESGIIHLHHNHNLPGLEHRCSCESWYDFPRMVGFSLVDKIWFHFHLFVCVFAVPTLFVGFYLYNMQTCLETFAIVFVVVRLFVLLSGQIYRCIIFYLDNKYRVSQKKCTFRMLLELLARSLFAGTPCVWRLIFWSFLTKTKQDQAPPSHVNGKI